MEGMESGASKKGGRGSTRFFLTRILQIRPPHAQGHRFIDRQPWGPKAAEPFGFSAAKSLLNNLVKNWVLALGNLRKLGVFPGSRKDTLAPETRGKGPNRNLQHPMETMPEFPRACPCRFDSGPRQYPI